MHSGHTQNASVKLRHQSKPRLSQALGRRYEGQCKNIEKAVPLNMTGSFIFFRGLVLSHDPIDLLPAQEQQTVHSIQVDTTANS